MVLSVLSVQVMAICELTVESEEFQR